MKAPCPHPATRGTFAVCLALAAAPSAWASYGQMRLDGITFFLAVAALSFWALLLVLALLVGLGRYVGFAWIATVITVALTGLLVFAWPDGRATMRPRPLTGPAMYVVLTLAAIPVMLAAPFMKLAGKGRPVLLLALAVALAPVGSVLYAMGQDVAGERIVERTRAVVPGQVGPTVDASLRRPGSSWLPHSVWNPQTEAKWLILGLGQTPMVNSVSPLAPTDAQAIASLVQSAAGTPNEMITHRLEGKLIWDRLMAAEPADRLAVASGLSREQAHRFKWFVIEAPASWSCPPLADPPTEQAFVRVVERMQDPDNPEFANRIREKCGRALPLPGRNR